MASFLLAVNGALAAVVVVLGVVYAFLRRSVAKDPSLRHQVHAMKRDTAEWSVPYAALDFGRELGKGSQGEVFAAKLRGTEVAVKRVDTSAVDPEVLNEFQQECAILTRLRHPNITLFMGAAVQYPYVALCTELVHRGSLFHVLRDKTVPLPWPRALHIALDIAQGLQYLHEYSPPIIHRDLKSLNILVTTSWRAKVADFGMTRFKGDGTMTQCGSPLWMPPEMISNVAYDSSADVYSLGIILWELYTRRIPYRGSGLKPAKLVVKVVREGLRPVLPLQAPLQYCRLVRACWHADPARRPSISKVVRTLQAFLKDEELLRHTPPASAGKGPAAAPDREATAGTGGGADAAGAGAPAAAPAAKSPRGAWKVDARKDLAVGNMIGRGSSATVFAAKFRGKDVAVKRWSVNVEAAATRRQIQRTVSAIMERISRLRHPNLVLFMAAYFEDTHVGMITERMERGTLESVVHDPSEQLLWEAMLGYMVDAAQGMAYLHGQKEPVLHGDLKSSRLLVSEGGHCKISGYGIIDFGSTIQAVPRSGYTAPEVLRNAANGCARSNVYSFGVVVWELLTRSRPYGGAEFTRALSDQVVGGLRPEVPPYLPDKFRSLLRKCWRTDPAKRPSFAQLVDMLQELKRAGPPTVKVDARSGARMYRKAAVVHAYVSRDAVSVDKDWGKSRGKPGAYVIASGDDVYVSDAEVFERTYEAVPGRANEYRKTGHVLARRMDAPFALKTKDESQNGGAGDYVVQNEVGEQWVVAGPTFEGLYELDESAQQPVVAAAAH